MKSIRLSMVAYFLILLSAALGTVSWLVYQTASKKVQEKEKSTADLFAEQCRAGIKSAREAFDERLLAEAEKLASLSKESTQHNEFFYPFGMLAVPPMPGAHFLLPLWVAEAAHPTFIGKISEDGPFGTPSIATFPIERLRLKGNAFPSDLEEASTEKTADCSHQYLQIERPLFHYQWERRLGVIPKKQDLLDQLKSPRVVKYCSESLGGQLLPLSDKERFELEDHHFDDFALTADKMIRRVKIKRSARIGRALYISPEGRATGKVWSLPKDLKFAAVEPPKAPPPAKGGARGRAPTKGNPPAWAQYSYCEFLPFQYVQYAEDTSALNEKIATLERNRDVMIANVGRETQADLEDLRHRLGWIGLTTFFCILIGSWLLIWLGLAPLSRLSDAVSKVTARDFRLKIDPKKLPRELMPIANRLSETLEELSKAFAREKQAAADISHELRTPLAALLTTAEVGLKKPRSLEEYRELLMDCKLSGEQMMQLVERLLALARLDAQADRLRPTPVDVASLARQCADLVRPLADAKGLSLGVHADAPMPVLADAGKLREVLTNLLHNAIQYNKPEGSIDLTVQRENGHLLMQVRDTGIGISPEARDHIFERFYRADPSRHSDTPHAGLGLAIVKSYVELMGGQVDVDSSADGSTFRIQVPAVDVQLAV